MLWLVDDFDVQGVIAELKRLAVFGEGLVVEVDVAALDFGGIE